MLVLSVVFVAGSSSLGFSHEPNYGTNFHNAKGCLNITIPFDTEDIYDCQSDDENKHPDERLWHRLSPCLKYNCCSDEFKWQSYDPLKHITTHGQRSNFQ